MNEHAPEGQMASGKSRVNLYVARTQQKWIVRDSEGNFWAVTPGEDAWDRRQPFVATEETDLEPVPGHYKSMIGLPF